MSPDPANQDQAPDSVDAGIRRAVDLLRAEWGPPPPPRAAEPGRPGLSLRALARAGFGDQLLQYGIGRLIADRHKLALEVPDWIGRDLFGFDDPLPADPPRPPVEDAENAALAALAAPAIAVASKKVTIEGDLDAAYRGSTARWAQRRDDFRKLFAFAGPAAAFTDLAWNRLANQGYLIVAVDPPPVGHDAGDTAPLAWYEAWLDSIWPALPSAALYLAGGDAGARAALERFDPVTAEDVADPLPGSESLVDFAMMTHADLLGIANSSFSFVAAMLNPEIKVSVRPDRAQGALVPFDPWDAPVVLG